MSAISLDAPVTLTSPFQNLNTDVAAAASRPLPNTAASAVAAGGQNIDAIATDFEAVFLSQMMGAMFSGEEVTSYFGGGSAGEIYKSFLLNEYGKSIAKVGGIGIASQVKQELLKLQEVSS